MNAHFFIVRRSLINKLKETLRKPGKLILYILVIAAMLGVIIMSLFVRNNIENPAPIFWFTMILFAYISIFVITSVINGVSGGSTIFEMNDVNLMFVSPLSPRKTLLYGVVRMAKTAFFASFFVLFQSSSLANFGIGFGGVMITFFGFLLSVMALTIASLLIYSTTVASPRRKNIAKVITALIFLPFVVYIAVSYFSTGDIIKALESAATSPVLRFVPISGWTAAAVTSVLTGSIATGLIYFALNLLLGIAMTVYILLTNPDFYEDVLVATETAFEKKRALESGDTSAASLSKRKIKVNKTGIPFTGAAALFGKHLRENTRRSRFGVLPFMSIIISLSAVVFAYFTKNVLLVLQVIMWAQIFLIGTGLGLKETYSHYIFLIPESSFKKIIWCNMEIMLRVILEGAIIFGIGGLLVAAHPLTALLSFTTYTMFSFMLIGINYVSMRFTGADISAGLLILIYFGAVLIVLAPGLIAALILGFSIGGQFGVHIALLTLSAWELIAALICLAASQGVLHNCDMSAVKTS